MPFGLVPVSSASDRNLLGSLDVFSAISSPAPRAHDLFAIPEPSDWVTRKEETNPWYHLQPHTTFHELQYRKCRTGPAYHEFVLLHLTDNYICRVERMGSDDNTEYRTNALRTSGIATRDYIQVFKPESVPNFDEDSDLVAEIHYPKPFDISDVLDICQALQLEPTTKRYNLWYSNCYFFSWTIITLLARKTAGWEHAFSEPIWTENCEELINALLDLSMSPGRDKIALRLQQMVYSEKQPNQLSIVEAVHLRLFPVNVKLYNRSRKLLWTDEAGGLLAEKLKHLIGAFVADETFYCVSPSGKINTPTDTGSDNEDEGLGFKHDTPTLRKALFPSPCLAVILPVAGVPYLQGRPVRAKARWLAQLEKCLVGLAESRASTSSDKMEDLLDKFSDVPGPMWRHAIHRISRRKCDAMQTRSADLPRIWEGWVWDSISEIIHEILNRVIRGVELENMRVIRPKESDEWLCNGGLQSFIQGRIQNHSKTVHRCTRHLPDEIYSKLTETMEDVWERLVLGDSKGERCNAIDGLQDMINSLAMHFRAPES